MDKRDLFNECLNNIDEKNPGINSVVEVYRDGGINKNREGVLAGLPITVKDHFAIKDKVTTNSMPNLKKQKMEYTSTVVERLLDEGATIIGKTNMPYMAMDFQARSPIFGVTNNPWNLEHTSGGSSSGAAAVSSGMSFLDVGSDLAGSLRIPAHFCGVYSIKPTDNLLPTRGLHPLSPKEPEDVHTPSESRRNITTAGLISSSLSLLEKGMGVISKQEIYETGWNKELTVAWMDNWPGLELTPEYKEQIHNFIDKCKKSDIKTTKIEKPPFDITNIYKLFGALVSTILVKVPLFFRVIFKLMEVKPPKDFTLENGIIFPTKKVQTQIQRERDSITKQLESFLDSYDVLLCPVTVSDAPKHQTEKVNKKGLHPPYSIVDFNGVKTEYGRGMSAMTIPFNVTGSPVVTLPIGFTKNNLPVGIQVIGKRYSDMELIKKAVILDKYGR